MPKSCWFGAGVMIGYLGATTGVGAIVILYGKKYVKRKMKGA